MLVAAHPFPAMPRYNPGILTQDGVPIAGFGDMLSNLATSVQQNYSTYKPVYESLKKVADSASDTVRGKPGGIEAGVGEMIGNTINSMKKRKAKGGR